MSIMPSNVPFDVMKACQVLAESRKTSQVAEDAVVAIAASRIVSELLGEVRDFHPSANDQRMTLLKWILLFGADQRPAEYTRVSAILHHVGGKRIDNCASRLQAELDEQLRQYGAEVDSLTLSHEPTRSLLELRARPIA